MLSSANHPVEKEVIAAADYATCIYTLLVYTMAPVQSSPSSDVV